MCLYDVRIIFTWSILATTSSAAATTACNAATSVSLSFAPPPAPAAAPPPAPPELPPVAEAASAVAAAAAAVVAGSVAVPEAASPAAAGVVAGTKKNKLVVGYALTLYIYRRSEVYPDFCGGISLNGTVTRLLWWVHKYLLGGRVLGGLRCQAVPAIPHLLNDENSSRINFPEA